MGFAGVIWSLGAILMLLGAIWVIYDVVVKQRKMSRVNTAIWIVCAVLFSLLTAVIYYFAIKSRQK